MVHILYVCVGVEGGQSVYLASRGQTSPCSPPVSAGGQTVSYIFWQPLSELSKTAQVNKWSLELPSLPPPNVSFSKLDSKCCYWSCSRSAAPLEMTREPNPLFMACGCIFPSPKYFCSLVTSFYFMAVCPFSFLYLSFISPLSHFLIFKINEQDIQYQEQLGHGNGGTVYKWVLFTSSLPWSLIGLIMHLSLYWPFHFITLEWSHYEYCVFEAKGHVLYLA